MDNIDVDFLGSVLKVIVKIIFKDCKSFLWSWWGNNNKNVYMEINYIIKMFIINSVDLSNDYGSINFNEIRGNVKINCDYG